MANSHVDLYLVSGAGLLCLTGGGGHALLLSYSVANISAVGPDCQFAGFISRRASTEHKQKQVYHSWIPVTDAATCCVGYI